MMHAGSRRTRQGSLGNRRRTNKNRSGWDRLVLARELEDRAASRLRSGVQGRSSRVETQRFDPRPLLLRTLLQAPVVEQAQRRRVLGHGGKDDPQRAFAFDAQSYRLDAFQETEWTAR